MDAKRIAELRELQKELWGTETREAKREAVQALPECLDEIERLRKALTIAFKESGCCYVCREREHAPGCPLR